MIRIRILLILMLIITGNLFSQENDFGIWLEINGTHKIVKKLNLNLSGEIRTNDNSSKVDKVFGEGGLEYNVGKNISLAGNYRLISCREDDGYFYWRHRIFADFQIKYPVKDFTFYARLRLQRSTKTYFEDEDDLNARYVWRCRFKTKYNTPGFPVNPWLYYELFSPGFSGEGFSVDKSRISAGIDIKLGKKTELQVGYLLQNYSNRNLQHKHVLNLGYGFKF